MECNCNYNKILKNAASTSILKELHSLRNKDGDCSEKESIKLVRLFFLLIYQLNNEYLYNFEFRT